MIAQVPYIKASELVRIDEKINNSRAPVMTAIDDKTVSITSAYTGYASDFRTRLNEDRFLQLVPNKKYTIIVESSVTMNNYNYIITYEAWKRAVETSGTPSAVRFQTGSPKTVTKQFTTGASGKVHIFIGSKVGQVRIQIK